MRRCAVFLFWLGLGFGVANAQEAARGWLGAEAGEVTQEEAARLGFEAPHGAKVIAPAEGSPAASAGLQSGDVILSVDKQEIDGKADFDAAIGAREPGAAVRLRLLRGGKEKTVSVTLAAQPVEPKPDADMPLPMLDTGGHMALVRSVIFTRDGSQLVSASDDKTIRVWDVATGKTVRTLRGEASPGPAGKIYAMALSPNGKWLAAGGYVGSFTGLKKSEDEDSHKIRLYDFESGNLVALLKGHKNVINGLAFSPDGSRLISGSADNTAIIWDVATHEAKLKLEGHTAAILVVAFTPDGERLVTASRDHDLRLWSAKSGAMLHVMSGHDNQVQSLAIARDGIIASGDRSGGIRLWDGQTGTLIKPLAQQKNGIGTLSFSPDGKTLLTGPSISAPYACLVYDMTSGNEIYTYKGHDNVVIASDISPDGRWAATAGGKNNEIHIWDLRTGERRQGPNGQVLTLGGTGRPVYAAGFSADGRQLGWGNTDAGSVNSSREPYEFMLTLPLLSGSLPGPQELAPEAASNFLRAKPRFGSLSLSPRKAGTYGYDAVLEIRDGDKVQASIERGTSDGYGHWAFGFSPDGKTIISGGANGWISDYTLNGEKLGGFVGHESVVWAITPSPDGRYLVSGSDDQTIRLWNLKTHKLIVTLFRGADGEWVMWTPEGYYAASGPGSDLIGWQINHGPENAAEYVTAAQLRKVLNRPDIVTKAIQLASSEEAVRTSPGTDFKLVDLLTKPVPRFRIVSPTPNATVRVGKVEVEIALESTPDPVKLIRIQVNGSQVAEHQPKQGAGFAPGKLKFQVPLSAGRNTIRVIAVNDTGDTPGEVVVTNQGKGALDKLGVLYILAIGIDKYPHLGKACFELDGKTPKTCDLKSAGADAKAFAEAMEKRAGPLHERTVKRVLVNGGKLEDAPTAANILDALGALRKSGPNDTIMLFVSGHGFTEAQSYRILATDAAYGSGGALRDSTVVPWVIFQERIEAANGRRILFLDTCHSGNSYNQRLSNDSYAANIIVYSAARWDQDALEDYSLGHGLFTYAVVQGINGAAKNPNGEVKTESLRDFLRSRVQEMAKKLKGNQEPQYFRGRDAQDYLLTMSK